jgi:RNA polymerase sigma-70 factor (ECF subfamily)
MLCDSFEAEDALQNLYLKLWEQKEKLDTLVTPIAYCRTLLRNICIDHLRIKSKENEQFTVIENIQLPSPPNIETKETKEHIAHFLSTLPPQHKKIMQMTISGFNTDEIEKITGLSQGNIRVILSRVRKKFREYYNNV